MFLLCWCHQVDEEMRQELAQLKLVVDKDKGGKGNAKVENNLQKDLPDRGKRSLSVCVSISLQKKKGAKSGKKKKKEKDLTSDR